jgi:hypothetical protein
MTRYIRSLTTITAPLALACASMAKAEIPNDAWGTVDEANLPKAIAAKGKTARAKYDEYKAAQNEYFDALRAGFKAQGLFGDGETMILKRMGWGELRSAVVPEAQTVKAKSQKKMFKLAK